MAKEKDFSIEELELMLAQKRNEQKQLKKKEIKEIKLKKKLGFSERLVLKILIASWLVIAIAVVYVLKYQTSDVWGYILDAVKWLSTGTVGFFIWKARGENLIRIKNNPNFNLEEYIQQAWQEFEDEGRNIHNNY